MVDAPERMGARIEGTQRPIRSDHDVAGRRDGSAKAFLARPQFELHSFECRPALRPRIDLKTFPRRTGEAIVRLRHDGENSFPDIEARRALPESLVSEPDRHAVRGKHQLAVHIPEIGLW